MFGLLFQYTLVSLERYTQVFFFNEINSYLHSIVMLSIFAKYGIVFEHYVVICFGRSWEERTTKLKQMIVS